MFDMLTFENEKIGVIIPVVQLFNKFFFNCHLVCLTSIPVFSRIALPSIAGDRRPEELSPPAAVLVRGRPHGTAFAATRTAGQVAHRSRAPPQHGQAAALFLRRPTAAAGRAGTAPAMRHRPPDLHRSAAGGAPPSRRGRAQFDGGGSSGSADGAPPVGPSHLAPGGLQEGGEDGSHDHCGASSW